MNWTGFFAVGFGGLLGCWLRWLLAYCFNALFPALPPGTLAANLIGGLLMGCVLGIWEHFQALSPDLRLFLTTGFLGGLTTFSTFSAESTLLLLRQQYGWFATHIIVHLIGSIGLCVAGMALMRAVLRH